jgi:hypothetical protein
MADAIEAPASTTAEGPTSHTQNQAADRPSGTYGYTREEQIAALHKLREQFPPAEVRYRPQPWCKACSDARGRTCEHHSEIKCERCKQKLTEAHICLKFIGHAEATNRLLNVDPFWDWEPLSYDERGLPQFDNVPGLWIRLTVCGMSRIGYGDAGTKKGANAVKEIIGDAIRNAGMRFGMALNLWTTSDLEVIEPGVELSPELAAELGGTPSGRAEETRQTRPARTAQPETEHARPADSQPKITLGEFKKKVTRVWDSLDGTRQNLLEAKKTGLADEVVPVGDEGTPTRIAELLENRIAELEAAKRGERSAA